MRKNLTLTLLVFMCVSFMQCATSKKATKPSPPEGVEMALPLSGPEYWTDNNYYRAVQEGVSPSSSMAKKVAVQNARQQIAADIQADLKVVIENYGSNREIQDEEMPLSEMQSKYQELANAVVSQMLIDARIVNEKMFKLNTGNYKYYVCLQIDKANIGKEVTKLISEDQKLKQDFDIEQFRKVFDEKMQDYKKQR